MLVITVHNEVIRTAMNADELNMLGFTRVEFDSMGIWVPGSSQPWTNGLQKTANCMMCEGGLNIYELVEYLERAEKAAGEFPVA